MVFRYLPFDFHYTRGGFNGQSIAASLADDIMVWGYFQTEDCSDPWLEEGLPSTLIFCFLSSLPLISWHRLTSCPPFLSPSCLQRLPPLSPFITVVPSCPSLTSLFICLFACWPILFWVPLSDCDCLRLELCSSEDNLLNGNRPLCGPVHQTT